MLPGFLASLKGRVLRLASFILGGFLILSLSLLDNPCASASLIPAGKPHAIPAFARKYSMPCSSCHEAWPKLSPFGQQFNDNGYQMGNERDTPIYQSPSY